MAFNFYQNGDPSASSMAAMASSPSGNSALHLQNQLQEFVATDDDMIVKPGFIFKSSGRCFYDALILKYHRQYQGASTPEQKSSIVQAVADAYHYNDRSSKLHQNLPWRDSRQRLRRFLKPKSGDTTLHVELGDEEISKKINLAFQRKELKTKRCLGRETISPRQRQKQKIPSGQFVPKFATGSSPEKQQFRQQEDCQHHEQVHFQQKLMNQHNNGFQHGRLCRGVEREQKREPKISQLFESMRRKDDPDFLAQKNPRRRQPKPRGSTGMLQTQMKPKKATKSKKLVPVRKKQPKAKNRKLQQGTSAAIPVAAKKPPPPSASPENAKKIACTPNLINASSKEELDMAASVMMELTLSPPPSLPKIYPIGTRTKKFFKEFHGWFQGTIRSYNQDTKFYSVEYEDGDTEELEHHEIDTGSLPSHKYDIGTQYEIYFVSKQSGEKIGWFVGQVESKYYNDPKHGNRYNRKTWRYNVVYSDGDSEDVDEDYITQTIEESKQKRAKQVVESPVKIFEEEQDSHEEDCSEETDESSLEEEDADSSSVEEEDEDSSSEDKQEDPNPENIPYWTGKQHHQFLVGLQKYGLGNLEDIHETNCIPGRSFQELVRYWEWYASDMEEKGLVLNYGRRGTVNGKKGNREGIQEDSITEEKKYYTHAEEKKEEPRHETNASGFYTGIWTDKEKEMVAKAFAFQGSSYKAMSDYMKTRSAEQIASYYNKNKKKIVDASKKYADDVSLSVPPVRRGSKSKAKVDTTKIKLWTPGEHDLLVEAVAIYGKKSKEIETYMKCRKQKQILGYLSRQQGSIEKEIQAKKQYFKKKFPKKTSTWKNSELSMLVEGHAIFQNDYERIADYVKTRSEAQVKSLLEADPSRYEDESAFDLGDHFSFPIELYHVLNVAPFEGFDHIISWNDKGDSVLIHDNVEFSNTIFPRYTHKGTPLQKFYDNLELFGFKSHKDKKSKVDEIFYQPAFQKEDYKKVEHHCRKAHNGS